MTFGPKERNPPCIREFCLNPNTVQRATDARCRNLSGKPKFFRPGIRNPYAVVRCPAGDLIRFNWGRIFIAWFTRKTDHGFADNGWLMPELI
jgi:hypothetical protein